jgi:hypothetical protein
MVVYWTSEKCQNIYILLHLGVDLGVVFGQRIQSVIDVLVEVEGIVLDGLCVVDRTVKGFCLLLETLDVLPRLMDINHELVGFHSNVRMLQFLP